MGEQLQTAATIIVCAMGSVIILYTMYKVRDSSKICDKLKLQRQKVIDLKCRV